MTNIINQTQKQSYSPICDSHDTDYSQINVGVDNAMSEKVDITDSGSIVNATKNGSKIIKKVDTYSVRNKCQDLEKIFQ